MEIIIRITDQGELCARPEVNPYSPATAPGAASASLLSIAELAAATAARNAGPAPSGPGPESGPLVDVAADAGGYPPDGPAGLSAGPAPQL